MKKLLYLLSFFSFLSYFSISIGGLNAKYDQLFTILVFFIFLVYVVMIKRSIYIDRAGFLLIALWLVSFLSSYFNAPDPRYSLIQSLNLSSASLAFFILPNVLTSTEDLSDFIKVHLRIAKFLLIISTLVFIYSYSKNVEVFGVNLVQNESEPFGVYLTMLEPNIFGSFMLIIFCVAFALYVGGSTLSEMRKAEIGNVLIFSIIGIFISFTRGVWLGILIALAFYYVVNSRNMVKTLQQMFYFTVGAILLIYIGGEVLEIGFIKYKLSNFLSTDSGTGKGRVVLWLSAIDNWIENGHVLFGTGTYSFASFFNTTSYEARGNAWIGNLYLTFLHDTGIVGLLIYLLFYFQLMWQAFKIWPYKAFEDYRFVKNLNIGFLLSLIGIAIAFFFTTALTFAYPWILFGLVSAFNRINQMKLMTDSDRTLVSDIDIVRP